VLPALGLDRQQEAVATGQLDAQQGVHVPFERSDLREIRVHERHRDGLREGNAQSAEGTRE